MQASLRNGTFRRRAGEYTSTIGEPDIPSVRKISAVFSQIAVNRYNISDPKRVPPPPTPEQDIGTRQLKVPTGDAAAGVSHVDLKMRMRVHPLNSCYASRKPYALIGVIFGGEGVMGPRDFR